MDPSLHPPFIYPSLTPVPVPRSLFPLTPFIPHSEEEMAEMEQAEESVDSNKFENDDRKLFVGGLTWETTVDQLKAYFEKYGTVKVRRSE